MQRLQRHNHLGGRTVRVRDDHLFLIAKHRIGIHLWHDQWHIRIIAVKAGVIDHHTARSRRLGRINLGRIRADGKKRHIPTGEIKGIKIFAFQGLVAKTDFCSHGFTRRKRHNLIHREFPLSEDIQHFAAHVARGPNDSDSIAHHGLHLCPSAPYPKAAPRGRAKHHFTQWPVRCAARGSVDAQAPKRHQRQRRSTRPTYNRRSDHTSCHPARRP